MIRAAGAAVATTLIVGCGAGGSERVTVRVNTCSAAPLRHLSADARLDRATKERLLLLAQRATASPSKTYTVCEQLSMRTSISGWPAAVREMVLAASRGAS
jgi:hypothetical protein